MFYLGRRDEAVNLLREATRRYPDYAGVWSALALDLNELKRFDEAETVFERALALNPNDDELWTGKGEMLRHLGRHQESLDAFEHALAVTPDEAFVWSNKAAALIALERYEEALACEEHALSIDAESEVAWQHKRFIFMRLRRYEDALAAAERLIELNPSNASNWVNKASALYEVERYEAALAAYDEAFRLDHDSPRMVEVRTFVGRYLRRTTMDQRLRLRDGHWLGYLDYGDPAGAPILCCHGSPGSRLDQFMYEDRLKALHIRLIVPDRPGYGLSDDQPHRTILDWPDDAVQLADHLGLSRFAVLGVSAGGAYAAACSMKIPQRLTRVGLVSSPAPAGTPGFHLAANRLAYASWRYVPWPVMRLFTRATNPLIFSDPALVYSLTRRRLRAADQEFWEGKPSLVALEATIEPYRNKQIGLDEDCYLLARPWGFRLEDIATEVWLWHGERDTLATLKMARYVAETIPNCHATFYPGEGHTIWARHAEEILTALTA